jgi:RimJ/RimL family protein N-acetyltransferase
VDIYAARNYGPLPRGAKFFMELLPHSVANFTWSCEPRRMFPDSLTTPRLLLRPIALADAGEIFAGYGQDPEVTRFLLWTPHESLADAEGFVRQCLVDPPERKRTYVVCGRDDGAVRGGFELRRDRAHHVEFGYVLARAWWGQGLMSEALNAVVDWAMAEPGCFRLSGWCDAENAGSARVMEKAGLAREGLMRRWVVAPNISAEPRDCLVFAKVR